MEIEFGLQKIDSIVKVRFVLNCVSKKSTSSIQHSTMMETTPRTRNSTRYRRVPTPKMSERKKKLFEDVLNNGDSPSIRNPYVRLERLIIEEGEDSDLGPMSPLEFSSSPSSFNEVHRIIARDENTKMHRIDFTNILNDHDHLTNGYKNGQMDAKHSNKRIPQVRITNHLTDDCTNDAKDNGDEDMMEPLCSSMKKLTSMTEQNYEQQMKTPSETTTTIKSASEPIGRNTSFRKSLVFDTSLTPNEDNESTTSCTSKFSDHDHNGGGSGDRVDPKAKTSLTFNEPTISVRSFYGKPIEKPIDENRENDLIENGHEFGAVIAAVAAKHKMKLKLKSKSKSKLKSLSQRMKAAPSLWRFSGKVKFNQHKRQRPHKSIKKKTNLNASMNKSDAANDSADAENLPPTESEFTSRIEQNLRLQKILKERPNALSVSREINWIGSKSINKPLSLVQSGFLHSDVEDDEDSENESRPQPSEQNQSTYEEVEVDVQEPTNRKFFKSSASNAAKKYRIMGRLSATLKRGGDLKFDPPPKRKKMRTNKSQENVVLHNEITNIIDRLSSPSKDRAVAEVRKSIVKPIETAKATNEFKPMTNQTTTTTVCSHIDDVDADFIDKMQIEMNTGSEIAIFTNDTEKYRQMIPYNTNDPEKISQQESILELLLSNGICNGDTFKVFIAEPDLHKEKASQILDSLYCVDTMISTEYENEAATEWVNSAIASPVDSIDPTNTLTETGSASTIPIASTAPGVFDSLNEATAPLLPLPTMPNACTNTHDQISDKLFPIFNKNFNVKDSKAPTFNALPITSKDWIPIGDQQYQLDAGQKEFGLRTCPQCEMQYSVHEPEDELLHIKYHNCVEILRFKGWSNERVVTQIPEWEHTGRILFVCESDSRAKKDRVKEILSMVDRDLGFATRCELKSKTLVYLAIAKQQIVGVCVVQPLEHAHRMKIVNGVDCYTTETYPVKCGISRIWVAPQYRRHGIAAKMITSIRGHFLFGAFLSFDEIAFSSPTEDGKKFAASLAQRKDFLIYES